MQAVCSSLANSWLPYLLPLPPFVTPTQHLLSLHSCYNRLSLRFRFAFCIACAFVSTSIVPFMIPHFHPLPLPLSLSPISSLSLSLLLFISTKGVKLLFYCILFHLALSLLYTFLEKQRVL